MKMDWDRHNNLVIRAFVFNKVVLKVQHQLNYTKI